MDPYADDIRLARHLAQAQAWTPERILQHLGSLDLFDHRFRRHCHSIRDALIAGLRQAISSPNPESRLQASLLLLHLDDPEGTAGLLAGLRDPDGQVQSRTLTHISLLPLLPLRPDSPAWQDPPVPLEREAVYAALEPLLAMPDSYLGDQAVDVAFRLDLPQSRQLAITLLARPAPPRLQTKAIQWLAQHGYDDGALDAAKALLQGPERNWNEDYWLIQALETYCSGADPNLAQRAGAILIAYVIAICVGRSDNSTTNLAVNALRGIAAAQPPGESAALEAVLGSGLEAWGRGQALVRLAQLEGRDGAERLTAALADSDLRQFAAEGLSQMQPTAQLDSQRINALLAAARNEARQRVLSPLIGALIGAGASTSELYAEFSARLAPYDAMRLYWLANDLTPRDAGQRLVEAGVISTPTDEEWRQIDDNWQKDHSPFGAVTWLLDSSRRLTGFDCESSKVPPDYTHLIADLMEISQSNFQVEAVSQEIDRETGEARVRFVHEDQAYHFVARDFGDWYDVERAFGGLNAALEQTGQVRRFLLLHTGDQTCMVTFAPEAAFRAIARELRLPLESDANTVMQAGMAYEAHVMRKLNEEMEANDGNPNNRA